MCFIFSRATEQTHKTLLLVLVLLLLWPALLLLLLIVPVLLLVFSADAFLVRVSCCNYCYFGGVCISYCCGIPCCCCCSSCYSQWYYCCCWCFVVACCLPILTLAVLQHLLRISLLIRPCVHLHALDSRSSNCSKRYSANNCSQSCRCTISGLTRKAGRATSSNSIRSSKHSNNNSRKSISVRSSRGRSSSSSSKASLPPTLCVGYVSIPCSISAAHCSSCL